MLTTFVKLHSTHNYDNKLNTCYRSPSTSDPKFTQSNTQGFSAVYEKPGDTVTTAAVTTMTVIPLRHL